MIDWKKSMRQTYAYYEVDVNTWKDKREIKSITSSSIERDSEKDTRGSASFNATEEIDECYIRTYLIASQNGVTEKIPLSTNLIQTPSDNFNGKVHSFSYDGYTSLIELNEKNPPIGYSVMKDANIMEMGGKLVRENVRAPVVFGMSNDKLYADFVSDVSDTWLSYLGDLIANAKHEFDIDERGRVLFAPVSDIASLQPVWTYDDDNSSILLPSITMNRDLYDIPNVVEVYYSNSAGYYYATAINDDPNSPTSTVARGRRIVHRVTDPDLIGAATQRQVDEYAELLLRNLSALEYRISYKHGYCPVRVGDCVRLDYKRAGLKNVKAKVVSQNIECKTGCTVTETAVYTKRLWGD